MAEFNLPFGVRIANSDPVDYDRYVATNLTARNAIVTVGRAYKGLQIYVEADQNLYILTQVSPAIWEIVGSDSSALVDLKDYVDGSLATRDSSINTNLELIQTLNTDIVQLDASIIRIDVSLNDVIEATDLFYSKTYIDGSLVTRDLSINVNTTDITNIESSLNLFLPLSGGTITGDLIVDQNIDIGGDLTIDGSLYVIGVESIDVSSAYIFMNTGFVGSPPGTMQSGIIIERGTENPYVILYDETLEQFRIGITEWNGSQYEDSSTQAVATRENNPNANSIPFWNSIENRFDTSAGFNIINFQIKNNGTIYCPSIGELYQSKALYYDIGTGEITYQDVSSGGGVSQTYVDGSLATRDSDIDASFGLYYPKPYIDVSLNAKQDTITFGSAQQIPFMSSTNDFEYTSRFTFNKNIGSLLVQADEDSDTPNLLLRDGSNNYLSFTLNKSSNRSTITSNMDALGINAKHLYIGNTISATDVLYIKNSSTNYNIITLQTTDNSIAFTVHDDGGVYMSAIAEVSTNKIVFYNESNGVLTYGDAPTGGGGASDLFSLNDVSISSRTDKDFLQYDNDTSTWINVSPLDASAYFQEKLEFNTPASSGAGTIGDVAFDASYLYVCTSTNTWGRVLLELAY